VTVPDGWAPSTELFADVWDTFPVDVQDEALAQSVRLAPYVPWPRAGYFPFPARSWSPLTWSGPATVTLWAGCVGLQAFRLPGRPVSVQQVTADGAPLPDTAWVLDPDGTLVRVDGRTWPRAQNVWAPTWIIDYTHGCVVDEAGNAAAGRLATEIGRALLADPACRLNPRTRDVVRGTTSVSLADPNEAANAGLTGVAPVDRWVRAVNPAGLPEVASLSGMTTARHRVLT
jgi:hypothetical protein